MCTLSFEMAYTDDLTPPGGRVDVETVPVPLDCTDGFAEAFYGRPEAFLDPVVRHAQSGWTLLDPNQIDHAVRHLSADLRDGTWDRRHGHLRTQPTHVGAVRLVTAHGAAASRRSAEHA